MTVFATLILLTYLETFRYMARVAQIRGPISAWCGTHRPNPRRSALLLLLVATALAVYKRAA